MVLSHDLISKFVKSTKDDNAENKETVVYGTTVKYGSKFYVKIDGSDILTPVISTTELKPAERVTVLIKNHTATVTGNITAPAASVDTTNGIITEMTAISAKLGNFELVIADKVSTGELEAKLAVIDEALIGKANVGDLTALNAYIKDLKVEDLKVQVANIDKAIINKADITELNATIANLDSLTAAVAKINTLVGGNLTMENIQSLVLTSSKVTVDNAFIKDAMIDRVSASKLTAGVVNTHLVNLESDSGNFTLKDNTMQISDNSKVRVQIGKDATGDYAMSVWDVNGKLMFDSRGIKADAIKDEIIRDDMISQNANISGDKLNINSVIDKVNEDGSNSLLASKILFNGTEQTLDVGFNALKTQTDKNTTTTESLSTDLKVQQGQIQTAISNTQIVKDGQTILMKDEFSKLEQTVGGMKSDINSHSSKINANTGAIESVESNQSKLEQTVTGLSSTVSQNTTKIQETDGKVETVSTKQTALEQNLNGFKTTVSSTYSTKEQLGTVADNVSAAVDRITTAESGITQLNNKIGLKVEQKDIDTAIVVVDGKISAVDTKATTAKSTADSANATASTAKSTADTAKSTADTAKSTATTANTTANAAKDAATAATSTANSAKDTANTANSNANAAKAEVTTVKESVAALDLELDSITQRVASNESTTTTLTTQMNLVDGKISTAKNQAINDARGIKDTRNTNESPGWYMTNYPKQTVMEFKYANIIKIPGITTSLYGVVTTNIPWNDSSGGYPVQTFRSSQVATYERTGKTNDTWGEWKKIEDTNGSQDKANAALDAAKVYTTAEVTKTNNKVTALETSLEGITQRVSSTETTTTQLTTKVDTATSTANTAKSTADTAKSTADTAKSTATNAQNAANTATNTANTAKSTADSATNTANTAKSTADTAKSTADTAKSTADTANGKIDSLEIGGRNLLLGGKFGTYAQYNTLVTVNGSEYIKTQWVSSYTGNTLTISNNGYKPKGIHTISGFIKVNGSIPANKYFSGLINSYGGGLIKNYYDNSTGYFCITQDFPGTSAWIIHGSTSRTPGSSDILEFEKLKFEKGNKATDWTPAPEDLETKITSVETIAKDASSKLTADGLTTIIGNRYTNSTDVNGLITSKGYLTESQVQQKVNSLEIKFTESGGYNLLYNSAFANNKYEFWDFVNGATQWTNMSYYKNVGDMVIQNNKTTNGHFGLVQLIPVKTGVEYTASLSATKEGNVKGGSVYIDLFNNGTFVTAQRSPIIFDGKRHSYSFTFPAGITHAKFFIEHAGSTSTSGGFLIQINKPCFTEGSIAVWSPHPSELCDGIITATKDGINVSNTDSDTHTNINSESFSVVDNSNATVAEFGRSSLIPNLQCPGTVNAGNVIANNVASKSTVYKTNAKTIFVQGDYGNDNNNGNSWATSEALKTVNEAIRRLPDVINQHIYIQVGGSVSGFELSGKSGCSTITIILEDDCVVNSDIQFDGVVCKVVLKGNNTRKGTIKQSVYGFRCGYIHIHHLSFRGGNAGANILLNEGCNAVVEDNDMGHTWAAIANGAGCSLAVRNNRGSNLDWYISCGLFSRTYFKSFQEDIVPDSKFGRTTGNGDDGTAYVHRGENVIDHKTPSEGWNPSYTPTERTSTWGFDSIWSDETLNGWSNVSDLVQGYYSGWSTGRWTGYMQMHDGMGGIRSAISGGTNLRGRIYVQRRTSSGNSTGSLLCLYASDGTLITNNTRIDRGQGVWVNLDSSIIQKIQSGAITYFYLRADGNNSNTYFKCESNPKIEITYTK